jgi:hypothetical protein
MHKEPVSFDAKKAARALAKRLGPNWRPHAWDNLGSHVSAVLMGGVMVVYDDGGQYSCLLTDNKTFLHMGSCMWNDRKSYRTPEAAVNATLKLAHRYYDQVGKILISVLQKHHTYCGRVLFPLAQK